MCAVLLLLVVDPAAAAAAQAPASPDSLTLAPVPVVADTGATAVPETTFVVPVAADTGVVVKLPVEAAPAPAKEERHVEPPYRVVLRSLLYPGWGQMYNGKPFKALAMFVSEGGLLGMIYREWREASRSYDAHLTEPDEAKAAVLYADYEKHFNRQESYTWWTVGLVLFSLADAYVDANLITFEEEFGDEGKGASGAGSRGGETGGVNDKDRGETGRGGKKGPGGKPQAKVGISFQPDWLSAGGFVCFRYDF